MTYRERIIDSIATLASVRTSIFTQILNLAMANELSSFNDLFETGEEFEFQLEYFETLDDDSVKLLIEQCRNIEACVESLININAISDEELEIAGIHF